MSLCAIGGFYMCMCSRPFTTSATISRTSPSGIPLNPMFDFYQIRLNKLPPKRLTSSQESCQLTWTELIKKKYLFISRLTLKGFIFYNFMQFNYVAVLPQPSGCSILVLEIVQSIFIVSNKSQLLQSKELVITNPLNSEYVSVSSLSDLI